MKEKKGLIILLAAFVLILGLAGVFYSRLSRQSALPQMEEQTPEQELSKAPDITVYDADGNAVKLSDFRGKPVVLNFWASWCPPCKGEMPDFQQVWEERGDEVQFLMVNMTDGSRETVETASDFIEEQGYGFPVFYDTDQRAYLDYQAYSIPTTYFVDAEGNAVARATGAIGMDTLNEGIRLITES